MVRGRYQETLVSISNMDLADDEVHTALRLLIQIFLSAIMLQRLHDQLI